MVKHEGTFLVFGNIQAESWCDENMEHVNELAIEDAGSVCATRDEAHTMALLLEEDDPTEYGVQFNRLCKDDAEVTLILKEKK